MNITTLRNNKEKNNMKTILDSQETYSTVMFKGETIKPLPLQNVLCHPTFHHCTWHLEQCNKRERFKKPKYWKEREKKHNYLMDNLRFNKRERGEGEMNG